MSPSYELLIVLCGTSLVLGDLYQQAQPYAAWHNLFARLCVCVGIPLHPKGKKNILRDGTNMYDHVQTDFQTQHASKISSWVYLCVLSM